MADLTRPQHRLGGQGLQRARRAPRQRRASPSQSRFIVKNPRFPPLEASAADPMRRAIYLVGRERLDISGAVIAELETLNPGWRVEAFGDVECRRYLEEYWFVEHMELFNTIPDDNARIAFWAACMMYTHGGCYLHASVVLKKPLEEFIQAGTDVCTLGSIALSAPRYNPVLIAARPRTKLMARTVGRLLAAAGTPFNHSGWFMASALMAAAVQEADRPLPSNQAGIYTTKLGERLQVLEEAERPSDRYPRKARWKGKRVLLLRAN